MTRWRERAIREVRDELDRFLNFPINQQITLGDFGTYDNRFCRFTWEGNISALGVECESNGFQHEIAETYATSGKVKIQGRLSIGSVYPSIDVSFSRASALAFKAFKIGFDQVQLKALERSFNKAIRGGLQWERSKVIVTSIWQADGFTHLVAGGSKSGVQIEATMGGTAASFNFADPSLGLNVCLERQMSYCAVGQNHVKPYFAIHKLREHAPGDWALYRYGLRN